MLNRECADFVCDFIGCLTLSDGRFAGKPFELLPWQRDIITEFYGTVRENGLRQYQYLYLEIGKKNGKQLALDTPIPTPDGWKRMGDVRVGDAVFNERGIPCFVLAVSEIDDVEQCYRMTFRDGSHIDAGERHIWEVEYIYGKARHAEMTTGEIYVRTMRHRQKYAGRPEEKASVIRIPVAPALALQERELPIDPYVYGFWLGNGNAVKPEITVRTCDALDIESQIPYAISSRWEQAGGGSWVFRIPALRHILLGSFRDKRIPTHYLRASISQRWALLQGLMDSDGCISGCKAQSVYVTTLPGLADDVSELLWSLGIKNAMTAGPSTRCGEPTGETLYTIRFTTFDDQPTSRLKRKSQRSRERVGKTRSNFHYLADIEPIDHPVKMRCIQVSSPSGLYLAGHSMVPTHNSALASALGLYHTFADGERNGEVYVVAADRQNAGIVFEASLAMLNACPALLKRARVIESQKIIKDMVSGTVYKVMSSEAYSKHGYKPSCVIFDELHAQPNRDLWDVMTFGAGDAREQPVWIVLTTAGDDPDRKSIGWEIHEKAQNILAARAGDTTKTDNPIWLPRIYGYDGDDIYNEDNWFAANPSLGITVPIETVRQEARDAKTSEAVERLFRWLRLNQWITVKAIGWLPLTVWDSTTGTWDRESLRGKKCYLGLDLSSTTDLTALTAVFPPQDGLETWRAIFWAWIPREGMKDREKRDHVPFSDWVRGGCLAATDGAAVDYTVVESAIREATKTYNVQALGVDPWNSRMLTQRLMADGLDVVEIAQTMAGMSPAMKDMERLLRIGQMEHEATDAGRWCFGNVRIATDGNENIKPMKNKSIDRIDITVSWIIAVAMARQRESMVPASIYDRREMIFL